MQSRSTRIFLTTLFTLFAVGVIWIYKHPDAGYFPQTFAARVLHQLNTGGVQTTLSESSPAAPGLLVVLHEVVGLSILRGINFPVGALLRGLLYFAIIWKVTQAPELASVMAVAMAIYPWGSYEVSTIYIHALGNVFFLILILVVVRVLQRPSRTISQREVMLVGLSLVTLLAIDYRVVVWGALLLFALDVFQRIEGTGKPAFTGFVLATGIAYWMKVTPYSFAKIFVASSTESLLPFFGSSPEATGAYQYSPSLPLFSASRIFFYLIGIFGLIYAVLRVRQVVIERELTVTDKVIFLVGVGGGFPTIFYLMLGRISQAFIFLCAPLFGALALHYISGRLPQHQVAFRIVAAGALLLCVTAGFSSIVLANDINTGGQASEHGGDFILQHGDVEVGILTGQNTAAKLNMRGAERGTGLPSINFYTESSYRRVVEGGNVNSEYVAVAFSDNPVGTENWGTFDPLKRYRDEVNSNTNLDRVYSGRRLVIYQTS